MENVFTPEERARYQRHLILPELGQDGQLLLKKARVLVVGAGGLGSPLLLYLAAAGIGHIGIVDGDTVDDSNLHRQVLYTRADIGQLKAEVARQRLLSLNPHIEVVAYPYHLRADNALEVLRGYDLAADGSDNFPTRYLVNDACVLLGIPNVYASVSQFEGQVSVFNWTDTSGRCGPQYRDLFPLPPPPGQVKSCAEGGVLGVLPGIIGSLQANEVIKIAARIGQPLSGRLFVLDALSMETRTFRFGVRSDAAPITELIDYEVFCGMEPVQAMRSISPGELLQWRASGLPHQLIDVREATEYAEVNIGGELMPLSEMPAWVGRVSHSLPVVVHCKTGVRSARAIRELVAQHGFDNLFNLEGGLAGMPV